MKDVYILATHTSLMQQAEQLITEKRLDRVTPIFCKTIAEMLNFVSYSLPASAEVLLTLPGPTALTEHILKDRLPVLTIEYNNIDIVFALNKALSLCPGSAALGHYKKENPRIGDIRRLTNQPFANFIFGDNDNTNKNILNNLKQQGINAIVGGGYICNLAQEVGLSIFPLEINSETLHKTIASALTIADTRRYARQSMRHINIILECQEEAIIAVNRENKITFFNKSAERLFSAEQSAVTDKNADAVFPDSCFETVLKNKEAIKNFLHTVRGIRIMGDYRPVFDNDTFIGTVGTFSAISEIQKKEQIIRKDNEPKSAGPSYSFDDFKENGPLFRPLTDKARCFALTGETVLITGESGTGKEVMAASIHNASQRKTKAFLAVNCAAIPPTLMESELFGYEPGTFTGGKKNGSAGMFEAAHKGTIFLDEIGEMPVELQAKLLRVIQEKKVRRIGSSKEIPVDVRIIAATNKNLEQEVRAGAFRADLYYRLNILHIHMPPLRMYSDCAEDIAEKMLKRLMPTPSLDDCKTLRSLLKNLKKHTWPGNMRELENTVRRYAALKPYLSGPISLDDIFIQPEKYGSPAPENQESGNTADAQNLERQIIMETFSRLKGNKTQTARELGISRSTLWRKLKKL